ncbi:MAG TPA: ABC transporter permease [Candidatus Acetothermia bacterium]|nr:ABC transporter permease [Candidatus Acetothermia bacterium]
MKGNVLRIARHMLTRAIALFVTVVIGLYLVIMIANMGGYLDEVRRSEIRQNVAMAVYMNPANEGMPASSLRLMINEQIEVMYRRYGLDRPFWIRSIDYLITAVTLDLGRAEFVTSDRGSKDVRRILAERLVPTLVLFGTASLLLFFSALAIALSLSRRYGSLLDRTVIGLAPLSAAPGWFYGIFLILLFAAVFRVLPWGGMVKSPPPKEALDYFLSLLRHMILPVTAITISVLFASVYSWRTFFLIYSSEDYVELARAKGLSSRALQRRYILRPTLPTIITSFMLMIITTWMGQIILETVFNWPGLGRQYLEAVNLNDTPVIVGTLVIFAYLLAGTLFLLDFIYAIVDPRVRVAGGRR